MDIRDAIAQAVRSQDLSTEQMTVVMRQIMTGQATPAQIGGFLVALHMKGETVDEIVGAAAVMRELATPVVVSRPNLVDTCGTGGDGANLFNVSTAAALVVAAVGGAVAKHGNRSVSSSTGSSDLLEAAGVTLSLTPDQVARCIESIGVGFMFAPAHHSATKHAVGPRRELALRTLFNLLGPLTNPAGVKRQVIGVFAKRWCRPLAQVLARLGSERVLVVHSADGLDEISIAATTFVAELNDGSITEYEIAPEDFGIERQPLAGLSVSNAEQSLALIKSALGNEPGELAQKAQDIIALNSGAAIYACGLADTLKEGVARAQDAIGSGLAKEKLTELVAFTGVFSE